MSRPRKIRESKLQRMLGKFFVSGFVVLSFAAYVVHEHGTGTDQPSAVRVPAATPIVVVATQAAPTRAPLVRSSTPIIGATAPPPPPTARPIVVAPTAKPITNGAYHDGSFIGNEVDAYYGIVQVKATIQDGKIEDVSFLQFPSDRRTSQRINAVAVPYLQQEAIQAQDARVDIISGATLTSEAFIRSLQSALSNAKNGS